MSWLRRVRGAVGMGLTWAVGWAIGGVLIGASSNLFPGFLWDRFFDVFDAPLPALAIPGFVAGTLFSIVLGIAGRGRKLSEFSIPQFAGWGALGGLLLSLVPATFEALGLFSTEGSRHSLIEVTAAIAGPFIALSAISAAVSLVLARRAQKRASLDEPAATADAQLTEGWGASATDLKVRSRTTS